MAPLVYAQAGKAGGNSQFPKQSALSAGQFIGPVKAIFRLPQQQFAPEADELRMIQTLSTLFCASYGSFYGVGVE